MAAVKDIEQMMDERAPFRYQMGFDNAGFLVGRRERQVRRVLVCLDITPETIQEAIEKECQLMVAHHPVIWGTIGRVTDETTTGRNLLTLIEHGIAAIWAHTNLDAVEGGVNTELARRIGLKDTILLEQDGEENGQPYGVGRVGDLPGGPMALTDFAHKVKTDLDLEGIRVLDAGVPVHRVAVGGGA